MATMTRQTLRLGSANIRQLVKDFCNIVSPNEAIILPRA
jgi:hypothetical protein